MEKEEEKALITFLKRTKDGEYAKIDRNALAYPRVKEQREPYYIEAVREFIRDAGAESAG